MKSALIAKETFIEENYDYCKHPKSLDLAFFEKIKAENNHVNTSVTKLISQLAQSQAEIDKIEAERKAKKDLRM